MYKANQGLTTLVTAAFFAASRRGLVRVFAAGAPPCPIGPWSSVQGSETREFEREHPRSSCVVERCAAHGC